MRKLGGSVVAAALVVVASWLWAPPSQAGRGGHYGHGPGVVVSVGVGPGVGWIPRPAYGWRRHAFYHRYPYVYPYAYPYGYAYPYAYGAYYGGYYAVPPAVIYAPSPVILEEPAPVYIERPSAAEEPAAPPDEAYWYYCPSKRSYYPKTATCPEPWVKVAAEGR